MSNTQLRDLYAKTGLGLYRHNWKNVWKKRGFHPIQHSWEFIKYYPDWIKYCFKNYSNGKILLDECLPWMTFPAIKYLEKAVSKKDKVFEYGMGGSTLFFAKKASLVISVEHDLEWFKAVTYKIQQARFNNTDAKWIEPDGDTAVNCAPGEAENYSLAKSSNGFTMYNYVHSIDRYQDNYFDLVSIDGRARPSCIKAAISKVKPGKYLLLDNSERTHYQLAINDLLQGWPRLTFEGPTPSLAWFTETSIWLKPL